MVPIVEPEVLMDGMHTIGRCEEVTGNVLHATFDALFEQGVRLEGMLLKPNMVIAGKQSSQQASVEEVASATMRCLRRNAPAAVPGIVFLSGGQDHVTATLHLNAINQVEGPKPWKLSFSYGRALQDEALRAWLGKRENVRAGQQAFSHRAAASALPLSANIPRAWKVSWLHETSRSLVDVVDFPHLKAQRDIDELCINTIRTLSMDAVQEANSGHPGTPMALAPVIYCLWQRFLRFDPEHPIWPNRDRFVLSAGHASMLLYSMLHLTGVKAVNNKYEVLGKESVSLEDIKRFRQLDSKCPGHPEYRWTSGVETTTGPLGQGVATSVGMAIAARLGAAYFNRPGFEMFNFDVYALCGDGCMMEGISSEAASLAGHLKLSNLCWIYDNNHITIEGNTALAYSDDVATRFIGYGWNVTRVGDANDLQLLDHAFTTFQNTHDRPTLIIVDTHIAYGAPNKQDTSAAHGEPLGEEEIRLTKRRYRWPEEPKFLVPDGVHEHFRARHRCSRPCPACGMVGEVRRVPPPVSGAR